jgi:hypothetical protein
VTRILLPALVAGLLATLLCACSQPPPPEAKPAHIASPLDPLLKARQRAIDVQRTVDDQAKKQREAVDAQDQ